MKQTENIFARWGPPSLLVAKYIPGFSTVAPPLAGTMGVGLGRFLAYSAVAALLWAALPVAGGFFFRERGRVAARRLEAMGAGAVAIVGALVARLHRGQGGPALSADPFPAHGAHQRRAICAR